MILNDIKEICQHIAAKVGGTVSKKEFLITNKNIYILCHDIDDVNDFMLWLNANSVVPILVITRELSYEIGDKVEPETNVFVPFLNDCLAFQNDRILNITDGFVTIIQEIEENVI